MQINSEIEFEDFNKRLELILQKATNAGGFHSLSESEQEGLHALSLAIERYEDEVLKIMPLKEASSDPLFLADMKEIHDDFRDVDLENLE